MRVNPFMILKHSISTQGPCIQDGHWVVSNYHTDGNPNHTRNQKKIKLKEEKTRRNDTNTPINAKQKNVK